MPASIERQAIYVTVGVVLLFICDTFYMNASMDGSNGLNRFWIHESWSLYPRRVLRVCLALVGGMSQVPQLFHIPFNSDLFL